jgi:4-amino-4-deoxy-L-arabinose transferase-like glycosyltransferase
MRLTQAFDLGPASVFVVALLLRLVLMLVFQTYRFESQSDYGYEYTRIAQWIVSGEGFSSPYFDTPRPSAVMAPGYVYLIAVIFFIFGIYTTASAIAIEVVQSIFAALTCLIMYRLGTKMFNDKVGLLAAVALAFYPPSVFFSIMRLGATTLIVLLLALIIYYLISINETQSYSLAAVCGFLMGCSALVEPVLLSFFVLASLWLLVSRQGPRMNTAKCLAIMALVAIVCVLPWTTRTYAVFGKIVPIKSNFGLNLLLGNNPYGNGVMEYTSAFYSIPEKNSQDQKKPGGPNGAAGEKPFLGSDILSAEEREMRSQMKETDFDELMFRKAFSFIKEHPGQFVQFTLRRIAAFWSPVNPYRRIPYDALRGFVYGLCLLLAGVAVLLARTQRKETSLLLMLFLSYPISYYITHASYYRYRYPVEPFLILLSCFAVVEAAKRARSCALVGR